MHACMHARSYTCVHNVGSFPLADVIEMQLLHVSCLIQCLVVCRKHMREEFVRKTVENLFFLRCVQRAF
jgi:hypothetical protein